MEPLIALSVKNIGKSFLIPHEKRDTLKENFLGLLKKRSFEKFRALENISFQIRKGDFIGIVGKNGSGKSTLLKILAGIYSPDEGKLEVDGKSHPFWNWASAFSRN